MDSSIGSWALRSLMPLHIFLLPAWPWMDQSCEPWYSDMYPGIKQESEPIVHTF